MVTLLSNIFREEERAIEDGRNKEYAADHYENNVRYFAIYLMKGLLKHHGTLVEIEAYEKLLGQKHMAYAFYYLLNGKLIDSHDIQNYSHYVEYLYQGLVAFYTDFYGKFADNEEAICLLCKYYPKGEASWLSGEKVINALFDHIKSAGTPNDLGYAYHGIEQIQKYINGLPNDLILELLKQYALYEVLNQKIYRHQIFAIIHGSGLEEKDKRVLKFFYLDSLLLANHFNLAWVDQAAEDNDGIEVYYSSYEEKLGIKKLQVLKKPDAYWDNENIERRLFWEKGKQTASIFMKEGKVSVSFQGNSIDFIFKYDDWELENYWSKEYKGKIRRLITDTGHWQPKEKKMTFSLLYLDDYRGIQDQILDFDHRYTFSPDSMKLEPPKKSQTEEGLAGLHFYGKTVYSLSCIVGKNGTGKTSIVDFLRDTFYKILKILENFSVSCQSGYVSMDDFKEYGISNENWKFLAVFCVGENDYFLTNMAGVAASSNLAPYHKGVCRNLDFCKVAYFSQQMRADQLIFFENGERTDRQKVQKVARTLEGWRQCDYSEMKSFVQKRNALAILPDCKEELSEKTELIINRELCYQFSLLRNIESKKICEYLDIRCDKELVIYDLESGDIFDRFRLEECRNSSEIESKYVRMPGAGIGFFSSGQYAKLMFLAKLYWFLEGYHKDRKYYEKMFGGTAFSREEALQEEESAIIFIDEGELFYHPEWQRRFLATFLDMLSYCEKEAKVQVVITTNSPFVISDMLKKDVQYLSNEVENFGDTLGQNIHKLLKKNFFMDYTIGEYSRGLIETIIGCLNEEESTKNLDTYFNVLEDENKNFEMIRYLIQQIGEPIYRKMLEKMLEERIASNITQKETRIRELEEELARLKGDGYGRD